MSHVDDIVDASEFERPRTHQKNVLRAILAPAIRFLEQKGDELMIMVGLTGLLYLAILGILGIWTIAAVLLGLQQHPATLAHASYYAATGAPAILLLIGLILAYADWKQAGLLPRWTELLLLVTCVAGIYGIGYLLMLAGTVM